MNKTVKRGLHLLIISAVVAIFGVLTVVGVSANVGDTFTVNTFEGAPITYRIKSEGAFPEVEVADCLDEYNGAVILPETVENPNNNMIYTVTSIGDPAFKDCNLTSVTIPDSVTYIGWNAFFRCGKLKRVTIPNSVTSIEGYTFSECTNLTSVTIPKRVTSIGKYAFQQCDSLESVTIPDSVTSIGEKAFFKCDSLESVTIGNGVTSIGYGAFQQCDCLTSVTIGNSVTSIGEKAFFYCDGLTSVTIGNGVTSIGIGAFQYCDSLTSVTIPDSVTSIGEKAFLDCDGLTSVTIGNSVTSIGIGAFCMCEKLSTVYSYATSPVSFRSDVFVECVGLKNIYIPYETESDYIAAGWPKDKLEEKFLVVSGTVTNEEDCRMENVNVTLSYKSGGQTKTKSTNANYKGYYVFVAEDAERGEYTIEVKKDGYMYSSITSNTLICDVVLEEEFTFDADTEEGAAITYRVLSQNLDNKTGTVAVSRGPGPSYEGNITLPDTVEYDGITYTVTSIDRYAFVYHEKLGTITIPSSVEYIDDYAFSCCVFNKMVVNREIPPELGEGVFSYSTEIELVIPNGTTEAYRASGWPI